jgi:hypothetical protein
MAARLGAIPAKRGDAPALRTVSCAVKKKPAAGGTGFYSAEAWSKGERHGTVEDMTKKA